MNSSTALATTTRETPAHLMPVFSISEAVQRFNCVVEFVRQIMKEGVDYGTIPGTDKPTLYKPGAEKLTTFFGLTKRFEIVVKIEDWTGAQHSGEPFFYYLYRCQLLHGENLIAEADGSCNSRESKYRWRKAERVCPVCSAPAIIKGKAEFGGGWVCFKKKDGCGAKFPDHDSDITSQIVGRVPNPDVADVVNTLQKMSQKRALIAATLLAVNASEFFTQDMEDLAIDAEFVEQPKRNTQDRAAKPETNGDEGQNENGSPTEFWKTAKEKGFKQADVQSIAERAHKGTITWANATAMLTEAPV